MRIKEPTCTVFNEKRYNRDIKIENLIKNAKYYFQPSGKNISTDLEVIKSVSLERKTSLYWVTIVTNQGTHIEKINYNRGDHSQLCIYNYDKTPLIYKTREGFIKDFLDSTNDQFRILNQYKKSLAKKEKEMESILIVQENLQKINPEFWL